jgi:polyferredoxin
LKEVIRSEAHYEAIRAQSEDLLREGSLPKLIFITRFQQGIDALNESFRQQQAWDQVIYEPYSFMVAKRSVESWVPENASWLSCILLGGAILGSLLYILPGWWLEGPPGIKNNGIYRQPMTSRGWLGIGTGVFLIGFYVALYWHPAYLAEWVILMDPISLALNGKEASQWFLYGTLYTLAILVMGVRMLIKYRHSAYQLWRTASVMFFQTCFAFLIPEIMAGLNQPSVDLKNMWPLDYTFFFEYRLNHLVASGGLGIFLLVWGIVLFLVGVPVMTYFFGKRWYCSWVCGCGGLAETLGDPYRQLSDKSLKAWQIERYLIHGVMVYAMVMTAAVLYTYFTGQDQLLGFNTYTIRGQYGFLIGSMFAGVVGTGFYPLMGNRVWCRFGCPLAAWLGIVQRFHSRFRITTNGGQCISCGNCSTYCEMGIDVRWYAQRGQDIVRSSCVGCGICSAVCPRGVLKLENNSQPRKLEATALTGNLGVAQAIIFDQQGAKANLSESGKQS